MITRSLCSYCKQFLPSETVGISVFQTYTMPVTNFSIAVLMGDVEDKEIRLGSEDVEQPSQNAKDNELPHHIKGSL